MSFDRMTEQNASKVAADLSNNKIGLDLNFRDGSGEEFFAKNDTIIVLVATKVTHLDFNFCLSTVPFKPPWFNV